MRCCVPALAAWLLASAAAAEPPAGPWTVDDVILAETATDFQISPDGRYAVWVKTIADADRGERIPHLMRTDLATRREVALTRGPDGCDRPRWSPDGKWLAFVSSRPAPKSGDKKAADGDKAQIWLLDPTGGEPWPLTDFPRGVALYDWAGSDALIFTAQEETTLYESTRKEVKKDTSIVVEDEAHEPPARLFKVAVATKKVTRLSDNTDRVEALAVSPDGRKAVTVHGRSLRYTYDQAVKPAVYLVDLAGGGRQPIFTEPHFNVREVAWTRDSRGFYATSHFTHHPRFVNATVTHLYHFDLADGKPVQVDLGWDNGLAHQAVNDGDPGFVVTADGVLALLADGARNKAARFTRTGTSWKREWLTGDHSASLFGFATSPDGKTVVYAHSTASSPTRWFHAALDGAKLDKPVQLAELNPGFAKRTIAKTEVVRWKGARDEEVEGILFHPHEEKSGAKHPLVVMIHGGPAGADLDAWQERWAYPHNLMCQRGAFVLKVNYHGSSNYGLSWAESIAGGNYYDLEVPDVEKGVDALIAKGLVDPEKLGVLGWSNGGILTTALTVTTTRYKCAASGAGDVEWASDWGNCEFGLSFDNYYFGKSPLEDPQLYVKKSPFYKLDKVRTPTLIFFGTEDRAVPTQQGWMHYRALQQSGKADVRFILFPGEKHAPRKLAHQRRKLEEELAWFDKYLFRTHKPENEAFKPGSPLAHALQLKAAKRDGIRYGVREKGVLVPETVPHAGLQLGRFEVTRAQFAEFEMGNSVEPGHENDPAGGITFEKAQAYCKWLSEKTGQTYRLPTEAEGEDLYGKPAPGENTLDRWAGYAVNPDDATRIREKVAELGGPAPLVREVGSVPGTGEKGSVFDLGGNVAEWVTTADGKGKLLGGSADTPGDVKRPDSTAGPEYRGFRVVLETPKKPA